MTRKAVMKCATCDIFTQHIPIELPGIGIEWRCPVCNGQSCFDTFHKKEEQDGPSKRNT